MSALVPVDTYTYRARLLPALLALFAPLVTVMLLFPPVYQRIGASVFTLGSTCGLLVFFGHLARMRGHISETRLIAR